MGHRVHSMAVDFVFSQFWSIFKCRLMLPLRRALYCSVALCSTSGPHHLINLIFGIFTLSISLGSCRPLAHSPARLGLLCLILCCILPAAIKRITVKCCTVELSSNLRYPPAERGGGGGKWAVGGGRRDVAAVEDADAVGPLPTFHLGLIVIADRRSGRQTD